MRCWSHEELALRWKLAWPEFRDGQWIREPTDQEIEEPVGPAGETGEDPRNLSSLSWFMARWKEPIAKLCNGEMEKSGHFWEARFGSRELLDDAAVLTCSLYVDLNQVRAGMADSLENSQHSAIRNRILAAKRQEAQAAHAKFADRPRSDLYPFSEAQAEALYEDCWLAPIGADGPLLTADSLMGVSQPTRDTSRSWRAARTWSTKRNTRRWSSLLKVLSRLAACPKTAMPSSTIADDANDSSRERHCTKGCRQERAIAAPQAHATASVGCTDYRCSLGGVSAGTGGSGRADQCGASGGRRFGCIA